jgi:hypothetical protein
MTDPAVTFAVLLPSLLVAHHVGDFWVQTEWQAANKHRPGHTGWTACLNHVCTYTITTAVITGALWGALDLGITPAGFVTGQLISAGTHYWADRRITLARLADLTGHGAFHRFGAPRPGRDDNPTLGTGAHALDQTWHRFWLFIAALATAVIP